MASRKIIKSKYFFEEDFQETIGEVTTDSYPPWDKNENLTYIGKSLPRIDGYDKVSGTAKYTFDIFLPHMAHAKILRCPLAHAMIKKLDITRAQNQKGVLDTSLPFETLKRQSIINSKARAADKDPDFSRLIREGLPGMGFSIHDVPKNRLTDVISANPL